MASRGGDGHPAACPEIRASTARPGPPCGAHDAHRRTGPPNRNRRSLPGPTHPARRPRRHPPAPRPRPCPRAGRGPTRSPVGEEIGCLQTRIRRCGDGRWLIRRQVPLLV
jgi:hypothetical protein